MMGILVVKRLSKPCMKSKKAHEQKNHLFSVFTKTLMALVSKSFMQIIQCFLEIQSRCDMILSRLAAASCSDFINDKKYRSHGILGPVRLHAAHVLSMDALLAAGLELGSNAPQAWTHVFK